jgi:Domain of unknown function (DUF1707)/Cell wall-active antibiotics response 4TMS YvqF
VSPDSRQAGNDLMRASDADRDRAIEVLAEASAQGRLSPQEYSDRSEAALAARTLGDLGDLTADLPASSHAAGSPGDVAAIPEEITAVLGNETRKGRWVVPPRMNVRSVLGDCHLEMQQAVIGQQVTTVNARVRLGSVTIYVPDGVDVRLTGRAVLGSKASEVHGVPEPGAPMLVVHCDVLLGSITVKRPDWKMRGKALLAGD